MARGFTDTRKRRRRQIWWRIWKWIFVLAVIVAAGAYAYETGSKLAAQKVVVLQQDIDQLSAQVQDLKTNNQELAAKVAGVRSQVTDWERAYKRDVPAGELKNLYTQLQKKAEAGVAVDRLAFVIGQVENQRDCDDNVVNKRFIVQTPLFKGANDSIALADRTITVTAIGETATGSNGAREAWYDNAKPLTAHFILIGGKSSQATGKLPLHHSMVVGNTEHRFTLSVAEGRGFVNITHNMCRYP
jgi:cell division protein FtsB